MSSPLKNTFVIIFITSFLSIFAFSNISYAVIDTSVGGQFAIDKDDQLKRFEHNALDNLKMIDFFLCVMKVRADLFPNANYKAQVNEAACQRLSGDADDDAPKVQMADITLSCTRASSAAPQICRSWYNIAGQNMMYLVKVQLDAEPTAARPNGLFTFTWCMADQTDGTCKESNKAYGQLSLSLDSNDDTVVKLYDEYGGQAFMEVGCGGSTVCKDDAGNTLTAPISIVDSVNITLDSHKMDSATGTSRIINETQEAVPAPGHIEFHVNNPLVYNLSFDSSHGLIKAPGTTDKCYPLNDPKEYVHQYDLYNRSTGAIKPVGGGIPILVKSVVGSSTAAQDDRGWWDYWGLHIDGLANAGTTYTPKKILSGSVVTAQGSSSVGISKGDDLTVNTSMGVLRSETSYVGIVPSVDKAAATTTMYSWFPSGKVFLYFDDSTPSAVKIKTAEANSVIPGANGGNPMNKDFDVTDAVDWCSGNSNVEDYCFGAYSQAIGGWFNLFDVSDMEYRAFISTRVIPGMAGFTTDQYFKCYGSRCPKPMDGGQLSINGFGSTEFKDANNDSTYRYSFINPNGGTPKYYMFDVSDMTMKHCETWDAGQSKCTGDLYPVICGVDDGSSNKCDTTGWDSSVHLHVDMVKHDKSVSSWQDLDSGTRFIWGTSNNIYGERLTWPSDSNGQTISFSPPVNFAYDHSNENDRNHTNADPSKYAGKKFGLEYGGNGNLWGIDWSLDPDTPNCTMNCDYFPQISIEDGVVVDLGTSEGGEHVILARRMDLKPQFLNDGASPPNSVVTVCTGKGLSVATSKLAPEKPSIETIINYGKTDKPEGASLVSTEVCVVDNVLTGAAGCPTE